MSRVLDASALTAVVLPDEGSAGIVARLARADELHAPGLVWEEIRNILIGAERRGRIGHDVVVEALALIADPRLVLDVTPVAAEVLRLARAHRLTAHDALYLEASLRLGLPLLTLDRALAAAPRAEEASDGA